MKRFGLYALLAILVSMLLPMGAAKAAPKGVKGNADIGKKLFNFNILAIPNDSWSVDDTTCTNSGHRIFFKRVNSGSIGTVQWTLDPAAPQNFKITDCDGTSDGTGEVLVNEQLSVWVMIRIVGKKTDSLTLTCAEIIEEGADDLCLIDTETFNKGKNFTKIMTNVFDNELEQVLWTLETSTGFRNAQVWVYERLQ